VSWSQGAVRCTRPNGVAPTAPDPPTFAVATQAPHREVGSYCRLIVSLRAIPTGASPFEAFPSTAAGVRVTSAPAFPSLRRRKRQRRPQGLLPQLSPLRPVGVTRPSARGSLGLSCSSSEGCGVPQSTTGPGKPGRQETAGWNQETARGSSLPECFHIVAPGWGFDRLGCPRTEVQGARRPRVSPPSTEVDGVVSRCGCGAFVCRPASRRRDGFLHLSLPLHSTRLPATSDASPR